MNVKIEKKDKSIVELEIEVEAEKFEEGLQNLFRKMQENLMFPGLERERFQEIL